MTSKKKWHFGDEGMTEFTPELQKKIKKRLEDGVSFPGFMEEKIAALDGNFKVKKKVNLKDYPGHPQKITEAKKESDMTVLAGSCGAVVPRQTPQSTQQLEQVKKLFDEGKKDFEIAKEMEKPLDWVRGSILIMTKLPAKVHEAIADRLFSRTIALQLLLAPADKLDVIIEEAIRLAKVEGKL